MKKLLFLLFLIPVLSWADCPPDERGGIGYLTDTDGQRIELPNNIKEYLKKRHCEIHRCQIEIEELHKEFPKRKGNAYYEKMDVVSPACVCKNLGGAIQDSARGRDGLLLQKNAYTCGDGYRDIEGITNYPLTLPFFSSKAGINSPHYSAKPITPATPTPTPASSPKTSITDAKAQCTDIGFKKGTEKFGDCVLELVQ